MSRKFFKKIRLIFEKHFLIWLCLTAERSVCFDRAWDTFRPWSRYASTVHEACFDHTRSMFPPCSGYVLTVLGRISISTIISVCFEFVLDPNPCIDYSFFDEHLTKSRLIKKAPKKRHPKLMLTQMWSQRVLYKLKVVFWDKMLLFFSDFTSLQSFWLFLES